MVENKILIIQIAMQIIGAVLVICGTMLLSKHIRKGVGYGLTAIGVGMIGLGLVSVCSTYHLWTWLTGGTVDG